MNKITQKAHLQNQLTESQGRLNELTEKLNDAGLAVETFIRSADDRFLKTDAGKAALAEFTEKEAELKGRHNTENTNHGHLQSEFDAISLVFTPGDLANQYAQIDATKAQLEALEKAFNRAKLEAPTMATVNTAAALQTELQTCLVNRALGIDSGKEIERLDKAITKAETADTMANAEALAAQARHGATLAALEAKIATEAANLAELEADAAVIKSILLTDKAQTMAKTYATSAQRTLAELLKLMAVDREIVNLTGKASGELSANWRVAMPKTKAMTAYGNWTGTHFVERENWELDISPAGSALKAELAQEGYRL